MSEKFDGCSLKANQYHIGKLEALLWEKKPQEVDQSRLWLQKDFAISQTKHFVWQPSLMFYVRSGRPCFRMDSLKAVLYLYSDGSSQLIAHWNASPHMLPAWQERVHVVFYLYDSTDTVVERLDAGGLMNSCANYPDTRQPKVERPEKFGDVAGAAVSLESGFFTAC